MPRRRAIAAKALQFLILTATRTTETLGAQWDEISFRRETWVIPSSRMKMGEAFSVPLSDAALRLLGDQMGGRGKNPFVFAGRPRAAVVEHGDGDVAAPDRRVRNGSWISETRFRTWCSDVAHVEFEGAEIRIIHLIGNAVSRAYNRTDMLERRRPVMAPWADFVTARARQNHSAQGRARAPIRPA